MELQTRNITIDTQYFVQNIFDFNRTELLKLRNLIESGSAHLFLTDITVAEVRKQIRDKVSSGFDKLDIGDGRYLKPLRVFKGIFDKSNKEKFVEEVLTEFEKFLKKWKVIIIQSSEVSFLHVHGMYANLKPPFSNAKKKEFQDAFALEAIRIWRDKTLKSIYLLSNDDDWQKYIKAHKIGPYEELPSLFYLTELSTFIDSIIRKDEELKDQVKFADKMLSKHWEGIKSTILFGFNNLAFGSLGLDDEDVEAVYSIDCKLVDRDILEAKNEVATYSLAVEIEIIGKFLIPDLENATFDKEKGIYHNLHFAEVYSHQKISENCVISFKFNGGIERDFELMSLEFDNYLIDIPFDEDNFIDIIEWSKRLPVIVCGVENGHITENGLGVMEFENFSAAKQVFPQLDIFKQSKDFTAGLGNKITDKIRFETWEAMRYYST